MSRCVEEKLRSLQGILDAGVVCVAGDDAELPLTPFDRFRQELDALPAVLNFRPPQDRTKESGYVKH
jgi:hypothetical protein